MTGLHLYAYPNTDPARHEARIEMERKCMTSKGQMNIFKRIVFIILQCTWGLLPTLIGSLFFIRLCHRYPHMGYRGCIDTQWNTRSGLSLGLFLFTPNDEIPDAAKIRVHEYGHSIQSIVLGPLFLIIGLVSIAWGQLPCFARLRWEKKLPYTACFVESWASKWGELVTGEEAIWQ